MNTKHCFRSIYVLVLPVLYLSAPAVGQIIDHPAMDELCVRAPAGANDQRTVDDWIDSQIQLLLNAEDLRSARADFTSMLDRLCLGTDTTQGFRTLFRARLGIAVEAQLQPDTQTPKPVAEALVRALVHTNDKQTSPGLLAALSYPDADVRYLGAHGLSRIKATFDSTEFRNIVQRLGQVGANETNGVVIERIYRALAVPSPSADVLDAVSVILTARVDRYRKGTPLDDHAETAVCTYLSGVNIPDAQGQKIVRPLATLLRLDVERYADGAAIGEAKEALEIRVDACESFLERITGVGPTETIRAAMQQAQPGFDSAMKIALLEWVGSAGTAGALGASPWNVPAGAP